MAGIPAVTALICFLMNADLLTTSVLIWTTTPWTLPANLAVALNPNENYVLLQIESEQGTERVLLAEALMQDALKRYGIDKYEVVERYIKAIDKVLEYAKKTD